MEDGSSKIGTIDSDIEEKIFNNPWKNAYWFARMLINSDKYGAVGKEKKLLSEICITLKKNLEDSNLSEYLKLSLAKETINELFEKRFAKKTGKTERINLLLKDLFLKLATNDDIKVFIYTIQNILLPINTALETIPNNDKVYTEVVAQTYLDKLGDKALSTIINLWDDAGVKGCLNAERTAIVTGFTNLRLNTQSMPEHEANMVLTAYVQEFERRLGQKRKSRAGGSLEDVASFLFEYYNIKSVNKPEHFQADIEVDKWIRCKDKWLIGISCKRTLRERWKQVAGANAETLSKFKIKEIWHLITYDEDLSDDKLTLLGSQRHIFYLRDESRRLEYALNHIGMSGYVRPISKLIEDIKREQC